MGVNGVRWAVAVHLSPLDEDVEDAVGPRVRTGGESAPSGWVARQGKSCSTLIRRVLERRGLELLRSKADLRKRQGAP